MPTTLSTSCSVCEPPWPGLTQVEGRERRGGHGLRWTLLRTRDARRVSATDVDATVRDVRTPKQVRTAYVAAYRELQARGCAAAGYRLIGPGDWPRFCVRALPHVWRLVMDFPAIDEVRRPILEPHTDATDPYQRLADLLGVDRAPGAAGTGLKPGCCSDHGAPPEPSALP